MDREDKLKLLEKKNSKREIALITGDDFSDVLDDKIKSLKDTLNSGIEINNLDDLLEQLTILQQFHLEVRELKIIAEGIKAIQIPDKVTLNNLGELIKAIEDRPTPKIVNKIINTNIIDEYQAANTDELDDANNYYGFVHTTGKWYIHWISGSLTTSAFKYVVGLNNYSQGWSNRKKLSYKRFDEVAL